MSQNPLLYFSGLPKFNEVKAEHVTPAVDRLLAESRGLVQTLTADAQSPTWDNFARPLEDMEEKISRAWSQVGHMNAVVNSPELREAYNDNLAKLTDFYSDLAQNEQLYQKFKDLRQGPAFAQLSSTQQKIVENELRDFRLGGAELRADKKARFKAVQEQLSKLGAKFEENILDNTNDFAHFAEDEKALSGIPDDALEAARILASGDAKSGYKFTLHFPSYMPVLQYADNRALREAMYRGYATRASEFGKKGMG